MDENRKLNHNSIVALVYVNLLVIPLSKSMVTVTVPTASSPSRPSRPTPKDPRLVMWTLQLFSR